MIRPATKEDINGIISLLYQVHEVHAKGRPDIFIPGGIKYTEKDVTEILKNENTPVFVFVNEANTVLGYAFYEIKQTRGDTSLQDRKTLYIDDLCVDQSARGQRIGTALHEHAVSFAKSIGCNSVTLNVWELNETARKFYEKCGMKPLKTVMEQIL